jgi:protein-disulfide isomerase/type II secretory pathway component PulC
MRFARFQSAMMAPALLAAGFLLGAPVGCDRGKERTPVPKATGPTVRWESDREGAEARGQEVVALVENTLVTGEELDAPIRLRLYNLERLRYETRRRRLRELLEAKVLGPRARAEGLTVKDYVARHAREMEAPERRQEGPGGGGALPARVGASGEIPRAGQEGRENAFIQRAFEEANVKILLMAPEPPVLDVRLGDNPIRGKPGAPVTIVEFSDFQSPHCARAERALLRLLETYDEEVRLVVRDLPLPFHRYARLAAEAAECAAEQDAYWKYHDLLFHNQDDLTRPALERYARRLDLDPKSFRECLDAGRFRKAVEADEAEARRLGVDSSPTFFVNGRYLKGAQTFSRFEEVVQAELERLGLVETAASGEEAVRKEARYEDAEPSDLPLTLVGTLVRKDPSRSIASIRREGEAIAGTFRPDDEVMEGVELDRVERKRVYVRHHGDLEFLPLARGRTGAETAEEEAEEAPEVAPEERSPEEEAEKEPVLPGPDAVLAVSRSELDEALEHVDALEQALEIGDLDAEGKPLLRLSEVEPGSLYERLGLESGDVLMQVNGEWVHDQDNPLWDALGGEQKTVILRIIRGGLPKTFEIQIE